MGKMVMLAHLERMVQSVFVVLRATLVLQVSVVPQVPLVQLVRLACGVKQAKKVLLVPLAHRARAAMQDLRVLRAMQGLSVPEALLVSLVRMVRMAWTDSLELKESVATSECRVFAVLLGRQGHKVSKVRREKKVEMAPVDSRAFKVRRVKLARSEQEAPLVVVTLAHRVRKVSKAPKVTKDLLAPELEGPLDPSALKVRGVSQVRMGLRVIQVHQALKDLLAKMDSRVTVEIQVPWVGLESEARQAIRECKDPRATRVTLVPWGLRVMLVSVALVEKRDKSANRARLVRKVCEVPSVAMVPAVSKAILVTWVLMVPWAMEVSKALVGCVDLLVL